MRYIIIVMIALSLVGCKTTEPAVKIWWGAKGDTVAWEKASGVMQNYNWIVISSELEQ